MSRITSTIETAEASRYLQQLCKHWSHKFAVEFDATRGTVPFPAATLTLAAEATQLQLAIDAADASTLPRLGEVVTEHLRRFAFREEFVVVWSAPAD